VQHFYNNSLRIAKLNQDILCLLPKEADASVMQKFRPISLVNYSYKIIFKMLTNRLSDIMHIIVDSAQAAFILGRYILDNMLVANEIIHFVKSHKQKGLY
jgi:Reverse transcriptase (RNA-dependent DNA polymerase)